VAVFQDAVRDFEFHKVIGLFASHPKPMMAMTHFEAIRLKLSDSCAAVRRQPLVLENGQNGMAPAVIRAIVGDHETEC
jgi:hypothetical protein